MEPDLLVARHHGETVVGGGLSRSVAQGIVRVDLSPGTRLWARLARYF